MAKTDFILAVIEYFGLGGTAAWVVFKTTSGIPRILSKQRLVGAASILIVGLVIGLITSVSITVFLGANNPNWTAVYFYLGEEGFSEGIAFLAAVPVALCLVGGIARILKGSCAEEEMKQYRIGSE